MSNTVHGQGIEKHIAISPAKRYMALAESQPTYDDLERDTAAREAYTSQLRQTFETFVTTNAMEVAQVLGNIPGVSPGNFHNSDERNESKMRRGYVLLTGRKFGAPQVQYRGVANVSHFGGARRSSRPLHAFLKEGHPNTRSLVIFTSGKLAITGSFSGKQCIINHAPHAGHWYHKEAITSEETLTGLIHTAQESFDATITRYSKGRRS